MRKHGKYSICEKKDDTAECVYGIHMIIRMEVSVERIGPLKF